VPWSGWAGWECDNGLLFPPGYTRHGLGPGEFAALVFYRQQVSEQRRVIVALEQQLATLQTQITALEERAQRLLTERMRRPRRGRFFGGARRCGAVDQL
jgi:hypothetical protein